MPMAKKNSDAEEIFRKNQEDMTDIEKMMAEILSEYGSEAKTEKPETEDLKPVYASPAPPAKRKKQASAKTDSKVQQVARMRAESRETNTSYTKNSREEREKNALLQPKADYFDALVERRTLTGIRETAKELGIGQKKFVSFLIDRGYVYRDRKKKLQPYAVHVDDELFVLKEWQNDKASGTQLLITPKGRETFRLLLKNPAA